MWKFLLLKILHQVMKFMTVIYSSKNLPHKNFKIFRSVSGTRCWIGVC